jgi:AraC family transcriptional regulator of adaptative response/methylated-DNA-[protein]-cysteine methyltransferase
MKKEEGVAPMNVTISSAALTETPAVMPADSAADTLFCGIAACALGRLLIAHSAKGICAILIGDHREELEADLAARFPEARLVANETMVHDDLAKVTRFLDKPAVGLHLKLDTRGTAFQRRVWEKLRAIPVSRTVSYLELARWISSLASPRAVASACAANPIALAIPCHRVISSNGDLAGYRWGIERKRELIRREAMA